MNKYFLFLITILLLNSCEDIIDLELEQNDAQLVVDAWLNDQSGQQVIKLRRTIGYLNNSFTPEVTGATITVADINVVDSTINQIYVFEDDDNDGDYVWTPSFAGEVMIQEGKDYGLLIDLEGDQYFSLSKANRTIPIDSIGYEFRQDEVGQPDGIYAQIYARDAVGEGDVYWIKTFKNGVFRDNPREMNIVFDAGFDAGTGIDGIIFIPPIRELMNPVDDEFLPIPWEVGEMVKVEIHSITKDAFQWMEIARDQMLNGDNSIFALPVTNTRGNISNCDSENLALGFFNVAAVSSREKQIE